MRPAPPATSPAVRRTMQANRRRDTRPELRLRSRLHGLGLRYRVDFPIRAGAARAARPDIVFTRARVVVFVDGCFWHGCPEHFVAPQSNRDYWLPKIERNRSRDRETTMVLSAAGWIVVRCWEHEPVEAAAERIQLLVQASPDHVGSSKPDGGEGDS